MYLLLALASAAAYGASDFLGGLASRRARLVPVIAVSQTLALVLVLCVALVLGDVPSAADLSWGAAAGLAYAIALALLYRSLASGRMSVVAPITGVTAPALPVLVGLSIGENPGAWALVGIALAAVAIVLVSRAGDTGEEAADASFAPGLVLTAVGAGVTFGVFFIALARTQSSAGLWPLVAARVVTVVAYCAIAAWTKQSLRLSPEASKPALAGGALDICANTLYLLSVREGLLSVAATVTSLYPATTVLLASLVLRERLRKQQLLGFACAALALLLITGAR